ncbi:MAG: glycoside hydrolase family 44 protein [Candidatus Kapabacteria bacterium]|nr:glycoside hydrolase family 44 protein [Candidatus Kapabacteria bacterium]
MKTTATIITIAILMLCRIPAISQPIDVAITIAADGIPHPISPLVYGINAYTYDPEWQSPNDWKVGIENQAQGLNITTRRLGGNTMTSYNYENGFSNSGADDRDQNGVSLHSNNSFQSFISGAGGAPYSVGKALTTFHDHSISVGAASLLQLPGAGYVAGDGNGAVSAAESAPSARWKRVVNDKPGSPVTLSLAPDLEDDAMYVDEEINFLMNRYGASTGPQGIGLYELDNEPGLWHHYPTNGELGTHPRLHTDLATCGDLLQKNIALAQTIRRMDPNAQVTGPAMWGYPEFYSFWSVYDGQSHSPSDWGNYNVEPFRTNNTGDEYRYNRMTWANAYLANMKAASDQAGTRLLDVFTIHYYADGEAISTNEKRMQATRSLWDPTYVESSWITKQGNGFTDGRSLELLPKLKQSIADFYPDTKLGITEYSFGGRHHISGAIAQADALGIFGKEGVAMAHYFGPVRDYIAAAFQLFRNYDGQNGTFGEMGVECSTSDIQNNSAYASMDPEGRLHIILLNKNGTQPLLAAIATGAAKPWGKMTAYGIDQTGPEVKKMAEMEINGTEFTFQAPPLTALHLVLEPQNASGVEPALLGEELQLSVAPNIVSGGGGVVRLWQREPGRLRVTLNDALGRVVRTIAEGPHNAGTILLPLSTGDLPAGHYRVVATGDGVKKTEGVMVVR